MTHDDIQGWFNFEQVYRDAVSRSDNCLFLEIGSWKGKRTAFLSAEIKRQKKNITVFVVDPWVTDEPQYRKYDISKLHSDFVSNMMGTSSFDNIVPFKMVSDKFFKLVNGLTFEMIFIDGSHEYGQVMKDIMNALKCRTKTTLLAGHDYGNAEGVTRAVDEVFGSNIRVVNNAWIVKNASELKKIKHDMDIHFYIEKIRKNEQFKFLRWGDGELLVMRGTPKMIGGKEHAVFPEITKDVCEIAKHLNPEHINGFQNLSLSIPDLVKFIPEYDDWYNADVFHHASQKAQLHHFFEALKGKNVVIVGSEKMKAIKKYIDYAGFITVRDQDCYRDKEMVLAEMRNYQPGTIFLFCASRLSVPAIYHSDRDDCTLIDMGSVFDPYIGVISRRYHDKIIL